MIHSQLKLKTGKLETVSFKEVTMLWQNLHQEVTLIWNGGSFSKAELTLAENRNMVQKKCYYIFKTMFKEYLGQSGVISTYYLKTIMMWAIEQNAVEYRREDNIGKVVLGLLDDLYKAVITGYLSYYLIPHNDLLGQF